MVSSQNHIRLYVDRSFINRIGQYYPTGPGTGGIGQHGGQLSTGTGAGVGHQGSGVGQYPGTGATGGYPYPGTTGQYPGTSGIPGAGTG